MGEQKKVLSEQHFNGFREQIKDSTNRMLHNFITMFLFLGVYERSDKETKGKIVNFIELISADVRTIHIKKAIDAFDLTEEQLETLQQEVTVVLNGCLSPMFTSIERDKMKEHADAQKD